MCSGVYTTPHKYPRFTHRYKEYPHISFSCIGRKEREFILENGYIKIGGTGISVSGLPAVWDITGRLAGFGMCDFDAWVALITHCPNIGCQRFRHGITLLSGLLTIFVFLFLSQVLSEIIKQQIRPSPTLFVFCIAASLSVEVRINNVICIPSSLILANSLLTAFYRLSAHYFRLSSMWAAATTPILLHQLTTITSFAAFIIACYFTSCKLALVTLPRY